MKAPWPASGSRPRLTSRRCPCCRWGSPGRSRSPNPPGVAPPSSPPSSTSPTARQLQTLSKTTVLLTRPETADRLGAAALDQAEVHVLQRAAEIEIGADPGEPETAAFEHPVAEGLHAKTYVFEDGKQTTVVTGSANATQAGTTRNVEFDVVLTGPTAKVGVAAMWEGTDEAPGFVRLCQRYSPAEEATGAADDEEMTREVEAFHAELARGVITATVSTTGDGALLPRAGAPGRALARNDDGVAGDHPRVDLVPAAGAGTSCAGRRSVSQPSRRSTSSAPPQEAALRGAPSRAFSRPTSSATLRSVAGTPSATSCGTRPTSCATSPSCSATRRSSRVAAADGGEGWLFGDLPSGSRQDIVLFEPLIRAMAQGSSALNRVRALYDDLVLLPNGDELLPEGWDALWQAVWTAHTARQGANA